MDFQIILMLVVLVFTVLAFTFEWLPVDITALCLLLILILSGLLPLERAFEGFGSDVFVMVFGLLILTAALSRTGATELVGVTLRRWMGSTSTSMMIGVVMLAATLLSAFISNTASTALLLPVVTGLAHELKISPSRVLFPLAVAAISAGSITLIGTSTNIVVSGLMSQAGLEPIRMFELTPVGIPIALVSLVYMAFIGWRLVPDRAPVEEVDDEYATRFYVSEIVVTADSVLAGKTLLESGLGRDYDLKVIEIRRDKRKRIAPRATTLIEIGDVLIVEGERENLLEVKRMAGTGAETDADFVLVDLPEGVDLHEVVLLPGSPLLYRTLKSADMRRQYDLQVLAISRLNETLTHRMSDIRLKMGDILLIQATSEQLQQLERQHLFQSLGAVPRRRTRSIRTLLSIGIFLGAIVLAALDLLSPPVAILLGATLVLVTRCITPEEAYHDVQWTALIVIACMLGLGAAMEATGAAAFLAAQIAGLFGASHPFWLLTAFFLLTVILTQPMSNQAAAAVVFPVAIQVALQLDLNPRSFAIMIALAASCSFITPLEPASLLIYRPGRYHFADFLKVGTPLTILIYLIAIVLVPLLWPL